MKHKCFYNLQKFYSGLIIAGIAAAVFMCPLPVSANGANDGGHVEGAGNSTGSTVTGEVKPGDPLVSAYGDAWEVTLYVQSYQGSYLLWGPKTLAAAKLVPSGQKESFIEALDWGKSNGQKNTTNGSGGGAHKKFDGDTPPWETQLDVLEWGTSPQKVEKFVVLPLHNGGFGSLSSDYAQKIIAQLNNPPAVEDVEAGLADGTLIDWAVTLEPIQLLKYPVTVVSGSGIHGGEKYELNKREEFYVKWVSSGKSSADGWKGIADKLSNPYMDREIVVGQHNQPWHWDATKGWHGTRHAMDNYYMFYPNFEATPPEDPPPPPPPPPPPGIITETGFDEIRILEKEILANIPVDWNKDDGTNSNVLAANIELIKIKEKTNTEGGLRVHENKSAGTCDHVEESDDEDEEDEECGEDLEDGVQCDQKYTFTWTKNPKAKMDETDLKKVSNVVGNDSSLSNPFSGTKAPTIYQMTRLNGVMDLEFSKKNDVFKEYTWNNSNTNGEQTKGPSGSSSYSSTTSYATPNGDQPTPFNAGFQVSFNSHRFGKWGKDDAKAAAGGDERAFLPLAGYMMDTEENKKYEKFMDDRQLLKRISWILQEDQQTYIDGMYNGNPGLNFTWGHGGQHGTNSGNSDLVWNNEWKWTREVKENAGTVSASHSQHTVPLTHGDTCGGPSSKNGIEADKLETPRACFGRTQIIENTIRGHKNTNLLKGDSGDYPGNRTQQFNNSGEADEGIRYFIRENQWKNDRVTFTIPSTIFEFSPTYKMYADYILNTTRKDYEDVWMLASDKDKVQFRDVIDFDLQGGETVVRAPWSRDYDDQRAVDPNSETPINVLKSGSAYNVDTNNSRLVVTGVVHHWDESFFEPGSDEYKNAVKDNKIVEAYMASITSMLESITDDDFGFYTNLVGGTTYTSKFRAWPEMNLQIFRGATFNTRAKGPMAIPDPTTAYPKLQLTVNTDNGYVRYNADVTAASTLDKYRLNGGWDVWDSVKAQGSQEWIDDTLREYIPDLDIHSVGRLETILVSGMGSVEKWYIEDYEGLMITVIRGHIDIPAIRSNPATVYEKLSDFNSDMNQWSPEMKHPMIQVGTAGAKGFGDNTLIPEGSIGAGTYLDVPPLIIYPNGYQAGSDTIHSWSIAYRPYFFGLRGSLFDNAA